MFRKRLPIPSPEQLDDNYTVTIAKNQRKNWPYILVGYLCLMLSFVVGIFTIVTRQDIVPTNVLVQAATTSAPMVFSYGSEPLMAQENFFQETLESFKQSESSFIEANLSEMKIRFYKEGEMIYEAPILSKGREGSWWETPAGLYEIQSKSKNHLSSFGGVYQPWSLVFQGNFFIHGWPYYPGGDPVSSQFSGGCIRLADKDAEKIYNLASVHTPVLVYEKDYEGDDFEYTIQPPDIGTGAYLIADVANGTILASKDETTPHSISSISKLMTALVAAEYINLDSSVKVTDSMLLETAVPNRIKSGMKLNAYSLMFPLLLESDNTAANIYASLRGYDSFVLFMNKKAQSLGMAESVFVDAAGSGVGNVSTAEDLLRLVTYINNNRSFILNISSGEKVFSAYNTYNFKNLKNFNLTPELDGFVGGKTGEVVDGKSSAVLLYDISIKGEDRTIAFVILGSKDYQKDVQKLYQYITSQFGS